MVPIKRDPVSPKNTFFTVLKLWSKNPNKAPISTGKKTNIVLKLINTTPPITTKNLMEIKDAKPSNPSIKLRALTITKKTNRPVKLIDSLGIDGDFIESQAFGYLAIRSFLKLPISFPETTGCKKPTIGGVIFKNF